MAEMPDRTREVGGGTAEVTGGERQARAALGEYTGDEAPKLMEEVVRRENLLAAYARVVANGGAPGVDGMTVDDLMGHCREQWPRIRKALLSGTYEPQPVRRVEIPKPGGGVRTLGIPTVVDRMIQQALHQVLAPLRPDVLGRQLRLPAGTKRSSSRRARPRAHRGGTPVGGGPRSRPVLRYGEPRRADGTSGAPGEG